MTEPTIWISQDRRELDFSAAGRFGKLRAVFDRQFNPFDLPAELERVRKLVHEESGPHDWLILAGSGVTCSLLSLVYSERWGRLPLLIYHTNRREYVKREVITNRRLVTQYVGDP